MNRYGSLLILCLIASHITPVLGNNVLHFGRCILKDDPQSLSPAPINICINGSAGSWVLQKSIVEDSEQPPVMHRADGHLAVLITPWIGVHAWGHTSIFVDRQTKETSGKENERDSLNLQVGNPALSRHRLNIGRGRPSFRLNYNLRPNLEYAWGIDEFLAPVADYGTYTYDNQLDWTLQATYGNLIDEALRSDQKSFASARVMYDLAALEGTRISIGGYNDGLVRRAVSFGILNINGKGDETALEVTRTFQFNPYKPSEFQQLIRLSYLSHKQGEFKYKFQYDDFFRAIRIGGLGVLYEPYRYTQTEFMFGYAKREDNSKLSHWFAGLNIGVNLE
jgi:hypothetical protein